MSTPLLMISATLVGAFSGAVIGVAIMWPWMPWGSETKKGRK